MSSNPDTPPPAAADATEYIHPETGEKMSKNAWKKYQKEKDAPKKEKKGPSAPVEKKEKKEKKVKEPEQIFTDATPKGEFKNLDEFPPTYQPQYVEAAWQAWWEKEDFFNPSMEEAAAAVEEDRFVMVIPPPNVTGSLHLGHAFTTAIEDTLVRWNRMKGKVTLWVPGTDHAGIATQSVVEKRLAKLEGTNRHELGREKFVEKVWEWKEQYGNTITSQIRYLGASVDWTREAFTMDSNLSRAVTEAFCKFHEDGLLYRDTRLINWSCALQSAISEIEVDYEDIEGKTFLSVPNHTKQDKYEFGMMTSFAYKVADSPTNEEIVIATTRLETMLGDTAVAVHPEDPRYTHLHGQFVLHPFCNRRIPIVTDDVLVDMSFGTGAVKITPAHDPNDYACGKRKNLDFIIVITEDGRIASSYPGSDAPGAQKYAGMMRYDARKQMEADMKEMGILRGKEPNKMRLGKCSRSGDIIEPMLTPQWYVDCNNMAARAVDAVRGGSLKLVPDMHEGTWFRWLENIRDWCVSRQLWWGHRIPAYFARVPDNGENADTVDKNDPANNDRWFVGRTEEEARQKAAAKLGVKTEQVHLTQDEDVLDTWFSSGLFPFSVFGWPNQTMDLKSFFPTTLLETGSDILFFWVARMVMMSLHLTDQLPFTTVYLHAMVRDKYGRKMSKSLGNVVDPLEVIRGCTLEHLMKKIEDGNLPPKEIQKAKDGQKMDFPDGIPECGADALRFGLLAYTVQGRDINLDIKRVVGYRQFCNKIWNAFRFAMNYITDFTPTPTMASELSTNPHTSIRDKYILSKLYCTIGDCNSELAAFHFAQATSSLYSFFLYEVCDTYLELIKPVVSNTDADNAGARHAAQATLYTVLEFYLRLLHPFMPFVTEELWQRLPNRAQALGASNTVTIVKARYPEMHDLGAAAQNPAAEAAMKVISDTVHSARSLRADYKIANNVKADFYFRSNTPAMTATMLEQADDFCTLAKGNKLVEVRQVDADPATSTLPMAPKGCCVKVLNEQLSLLVDLTGLLDVETEIARLTNEVERISLQISTYERKMDAADYETKVPESVRLMNTEKLSGLKSELETTQTAQTTFLAMRD